MPEIASKFEIDFLAEYTDEALVAELRRVARFLAPGMPLTKAAYKQLRPKVASSTVCRRFGGWNEALTRAGLESLYTGRTVSEKMRLQPSRNMSNDELISEMRRVHAVVGTPWLTSEDFNGNSITSEDTIRNRFGSFRGGLDAAGIPSHPTNTSKTTDQQAFENLAELWTSLGRAPQFREMGKPPSKIHGKRYVRRWGTWRKSLSAFIAWANGDEQTIADESAKVMPNSALTRVTVTEADCRDVRPGLRFRVFKRDNFRCVACGRSPATHLNIELHADHINAVANGGKTIFENLQTLCQDCNLGKGKS